MLSTSGFAVPVASDFRFDCYGSPVPDPEPGPHLQVCGSVQRVLMVVATRGASWTLGLDLAGELGRRGVEVALASFGPPLAVEQCRRAGAMARVELFESELEPARLAADLSGDLALVGGWLLELEARLSPHVVHVDAYALGSLPWRSPVVVSGGAALFSPPAEGVAAAATWQRYHRLVGEGVHAADLVVAPTRAELRALQQQHGPLRRSRAIAPGRAPEGFRSGRKEPLIFAGGQIGGDSVAAVLRVARRLSWPVVAAGEVAGAQATPGIGPVFQLGACGEGESASWLGRSAVFALPVAEDPAGLAALEAAHAGCALVLAETPALRELWGDAAVFVAEGDDGALAGAIESLARDDVRRLGLARAARERARSRTPDAAASEHLGAYRQALAARRSGMRAVFDAASPIGLTLGAGDHPTLH